MADTEVPNVTLQRRDALSDWLESKRKRENVGKALLSIGGIIGSGVGTAGDIIKGQPGFTQKQYAPFVDYLGKLDEKAVTSPLSQRSQEIAGDIAPAWTSRR